MQDTAFSPNGDKVKDTISFTPVTHAGSGGIVKYVFKIAAAGSSAALKTMSESKSVPASFVWDGRDDKGALCSDGQYIASLEITSANASTASASTQAFALDTKAVPCGGNPVDILFTVRRFDPERTAGRRPRLHDGKTVDCRSAQCARYPCSEIHVGGHRTDGRQSGILMERRRRIGQHGFRRYVYACHRFDG